MTEYWSGGIRKGEMGARSVIFRLPSTVFHLPSAIFQTSFPPASAGKPAGALIVSVGSGLARSRLALAAGGRSYSIRRFGGPQFIEQFYSGQTLAQRLTASRIKMLLFSRIHEGFRPYARRRIGRSEAFTLVMEFLWTSKPI